MREFLIDCFELSNPATQQRVGSNQVHSLRALAIRRNRR